jgi:hypothetical protein
MWSADQEKNAAAANAAGIAAQRATAATLAGHEVVEDVAGAATLAAAVTAHEAAVLAVAAEVASQEMTIADAALHRAQMAAAAAATAAATGVVETVAQRAASRAGAAADAATEAVAGAERATRQLPPSAERIRAASKMLRQGQGLPTSPRTEA